MTAIKYKKDLTAKSKGCEESSARKTTKSNKPKRTKRPTGEHTTHKSQN